MVTYDNSMPLEYKYYRTKSKYRMKKDIFNCGHVETKYKKTLTAALVSEIVEPQKLLGEN